MTDYLLVPVAAAESVDPKWVTAWNRYCTVSLPWELDPASGELDWDTFVHLTYLQLTAEIMSIL